MRKIKMFYVFVLLSVSPFLSASFSQNFVKSTKPYITPSGQTLNVGDTICFMQSSSYDNVFNYIYDNKTLDYHTEILKEIVYSNGTSKVENRRYKKYPIKSFQLYDDGKVIAVLEYRLLFNFYVDINKAIESGEIASNNKDLYDAVLGNRFYLTDEVAYTQFIAREKEITVDMAKEYLYIFNIDLFNKIREDEFEFHKAIKDAQVFMKKVSSKTDTSRIFTFLFVDKIGNFDFDKESFPVLWENNGAQIYTSILEGFTPEDINKSKVKLTDLRIEFVNLSDFNSFSLSTEKANLLIKSKKNNNGGSVDRSIFMKINLKIVGLRDASVIMKDDCRFIKYLQANIQSIDFFASGKDDYDASYYNWLTKVERKK